MQVDRRKLLENPYRPGAGHPPPHLAGRNSETDYFLRLLRQGFASENLLITGLRGVGKTVLLDRMRSIALQEGWLWIGNDLSESSSLSEDRLALRIITDLSEAFSRVLATDEPDVTSPDGKQQQRDPSGHDAIPYAFDALRAMYERSPGLPSDKLRSIISRLGSLVKRARVSGLIFAYDEAQCLSDHAAKNEYPMSMLIETIASLQRKDSVAPCLLVLSGLPQVFDALTETRTYTERMFRVMRLERLSRDETLAAIVTPLKPMMPPLTVSKDLINKVVDMTGGYPYLIQFFGKELVEQLLANGGILAPSDFPSADCLDRLDAGLFASRWNRTTDKQREVLKIIAHRDDVSLSDFSAHEISELGADLAGLNNTQVSQALQALCERGLIYRTRHGRYAFTVPMSEVMIRRRMRTEEDVEQSWVQAPSANTVRPMPGAESTAPPPPPMNAKKPRSWRLFR